jgi:hypothetical protein
MSRVIKSYGTYLDICLPNEKCQMSLPAQVICVEMVNAAAVRITCIVSPDFAGVLLQPHEAAAATRGLQHDQDSDVASTSTQTLQGNHIHLNLEPCLG